MRQWLFWKKQFRNSFVNSKRNGTLWFVFALLSLVPVCFNPSLNMPSKVIDTLFVIDVSESMNVQDVSYPRPHTSRLTLAKAAVTAGLESLPCGSRVSLGLFAGEAVVVLFEPLEVCGHYASIEKVIAGLNTNMRWVGDSWVVRGIISGIKEAEKRALNLVVITDADEMPHSTTPRIADLLPYQGKVKGALWGVGAKTPLPVPKVDAQGNLLGYWTPEQAVMEGNYPNLLGYVKYLGEGEEVPEGALDKVTEHLSAFNLSILKNVALMLKIPSVVIASPKDGIATLHSEKLQTKQTALSDMRWLFAFTAFILILVGWFLPWFTNAD